VFSLSLVRIEQYVDRRLVGKDRYDICALLVVDG